MNHIKIINIFNFDSTFRFKTVRRHSVGLFLAMQQAVKCSNEHLILVTFQILCLVLYRTLLVLLYDGGLWSGL